MYNFYTDRFTGGTTTGGASPPYSSGGTFNFVVSIPAGVTIRKAYLFGGHTGDLNNNLTVTLGETGFPLTNINYSFSNATKVGVPFNAPYGNGQSSVHAIDVTNDILPTVNNYSLTVPFQSFGTGDKFTGFMLWICFEDAAMDICDVVLWLNDQSMSVSSNHTYPTSYALPIDTTADVSVGLWTDYICNTGSDDQNIRLNATNLGVIGSTTGNGSCDGATYKTPRANFTYFNQNITALADCNANQAMNDLDALSDIKAIITNGDTSFTLQFNATSSGNLSQLLWVVSVVYYDTLPPLNNCPATADIAPNVTSVGATTARFNWTTPLIPYDEFEVRHRVVGQTAWITDTVTLTFVPNIINVQNAPPAATGSGDIYAVGTAPTGAWSANAGDIATDTGVGTWSFATPAQFSFLLTQFNVTYYYNGTAWITPFGELFFDFTGLTSATAYECQVVLTQGGFICGAVAYSVIVQFTTL